MMKIDSSDPEADRKLIGIYHHYLSFSMKGFSMVLKRDVDEIFVNKFNPEWLQVMLEEYSTILLKLIVFPVKGVGCKS